MRFLKTKTIRGKILLVFSITFFALLITLVMLNRLFLVDSFVHSNRVNMREEARRFIQEYRLGNVREATDTLVKNTGVSFYLYTRELQPAGISAGKPDELPETGISLAQLQPLAAQPQGYFAVIGDGELEDQMLVYALSFGDGMLLVLTKAMGLVGETSRLFIRFMMLTSGIVYAVGLLLIFFISGGLARPIREMKRITGKMAAQQFDETLSVQGRDEIAELAASVNTMAGNLSGTIGALHKSNARLEAELSKERSLERMRRRFVSDVSHELKNPISVILGYADGLRQNVAKTQAEKEEYYGIIADEAVKMNTLTRNLLDLSSYESGTFTLQMETVTLHTLLADAIERFSYLHGDKHIAIVYTPQPDYTLHADRLRLQQVIDNLLGNAFKYTQTGGMIRITLAKTGDKTNLTIANTGPLIPPSELEMIWNSFYQIRTDRTGSGLGLAIVKSIVDLHGGSCRAYTTADMNCFEVIL